ncbi:hypothetical protein [Kosmotoga pacifica]|uniref:Uncharacterized protein n=1 Tax=Kosmotoga pacifica TaxID=1330330 RepID=A0A0G2ZCX9_9BACT|nr:hypothetical protein [Kosmotoga pacifica]AKI96628.1 hypothetical protein IX53_00980 [Kosmotoga pacifica]
MPKFKRITTSITDLYFVESMKQVHAERYKKRWEIRRTNNILKGNYKLEHIRYVVRNENNDTVAGLAAWRKP